MNFDEVIQLQVLKLKALTHGVNNGRLVDHLIEQNETPNCARCAPRCTPL